MSSRRTLLVLTRHTPLPWEDGAGAYLFDILRYLHRRGFSVHVAWLAPHDHLRWQGVWTLPADFASVVHLHAPGAIRLGRRLVFPAVYWQPFKARMLSRVKAALASVGLRVGRGSHPPSVGTSPGEPADPAQSSTWMATPSPAEHAFAARLIARLRPSSLVANYAWMTPLFGDSPAGRLPRRLCLHPDVAWKRAEQLARLSGSEPEITRSGEAALLRHAATIVGISALDVAELRALAPAADVLLAPKSVLPDPAPPAPGDSARILFVGSGNSFNAAGLTWFLEDIWPAIRAALPHAELDVCGSVAAAVAARPPGVRFHGAVPDLSPFYRDTALVVVPLPHATGLNIKLVDAAARGRAIVTTPATLAGAPFLRDAVAAADDAPGFAAATIGLLGDRPARHRLAARALAAVAEHLSPDACYAPLAAALEQ